MKNGLVVLAISMACLGCTSIGDRLTPSKGRGLSETETQKSLQSSLLVTAVGQIEPSGKVYNLAAPSAAFGSVPRVLRVLVAEGEQISKGQILVVFDNKTTEQSKVDAIKSEIIAKRNETAVLERQLERFRTLVDSGAFPLSDLEEKKARLEGFYYAEAQLRNSLKTAEQNLEVYSQIRSPIDGVVLKLNVKEGEIAINKSVVQVGNIESMIASLQVDESDIKKVKIGQKVELDSENRGFKQTLTGRVREIGQMLERVSLKSNDPFADEVNEKRSVEVIVQIDPSFNTIVRKLTGAKVIGKINETY